MRRQSSPAGRNWSCPQINASGAEAMPLILAYPNELDHDSNMSKRVKIRISGRGHDTGAPAVDDMSDQLKDYFGLLESVEQTLADDGQSAIDWRVVHAAMTSPIAFTVQAFPKQFGVNVDARADHVIENALRGVRELLQNPSRPNNFTDQTLAFAQRLCERVANGLDRTEIEVEGEEADQITITPSVARVAAQNIRTVLQPVVKPYKAIGGVEGHIQNVGQDGYRRRFLLIRSRLTGDDIKCFVSGDAEKQLAKCEIADVWRRARVEVFGLIHFKGPHRISQIDAQRLRFFHAESELPMVDDILDTDFTGGLRTEDYLDRLRNGSVS